MSDSVRLSVRINRKQRATLQRIADSQGLKFSDLIRDSVANYIASFRSWKVTFDTIHSRISGSDGSQTLKHPLDFPDSAIELN